MADITYELAADGVYGLTNGVYQDTLITVLEDHEGLAAVTDVYSGETGGWSLSTDGAMEGSNYITSTDNFEEIKHDNVTLGGRGYIYRVRIIPRADNFFTYFLHDPAATAGDSGYSIKINNGSEIELLEITTGTVNTLGSATFGFTQGTEYYIELEAQPTGQADNVIGRIMDTGENVLASVTATDDTHTSGTIGVGSGSNTGSDVDYFTQRVI